MLNLRKVREDHNFSVQITSLYILLDVHVKILGKPEDIKIAKERVLEKLDGRVSC